MIFISTEYKIEINLNTAVPTSTTVIIHVSKEASINKNITKNTIIKNA